MIFAVASNTSVTKMILMITSWIMYQIAVLWYGIATGQVGFILIFIFQFIATLVTIIISTERSISENI
jgi:hypothetical protein